MVPGREFQTRGAMHAKLRRANVVRDRGRLGRVADMSKIVQKFATLSDLIHESRCKAWQVRGLQQGDSVYSPRSFRTSYMYTSIFASHGERSC